VIPANVLEWYLIDPLAPENIGNPGVYSMELIMEIPAGYIGKNVYYYTDYVGLRYYNYFSVHVSIIIKTAQTPEQPDDIITPPDTTQSKFTPSIVAANIESVSISGHPEVVYAGVVIDFNEYLTVTTDSDKESDKRVEWSSVDYYNYGGQYIFHNEGSYTIRATSVMDSSKFAEVTIDVVNRNKIISCTPFNDIDVNENMGIYDIETAYEALKDLLPTTINSRADNGENKALRIYGWYLMSLDASKMVLSPWTAVPSYDLETPYPEVMVNFHVAQRSYSIISGAAETANITLDKDKHATSSKYLLHAVYPTGKVLINAVLEDGSTEELLCEIEYLSAYYPLEPYRIYDGEKGKVILGLGLMLPKGYKALSPGRDCDLYIEVELDIAVNQTSVYEDMWVTTKPAKMTYDVGEPLDLTGIMVRIKNSEGSDIYISADKFSQYGLKLHLGSEDGRTISATETVTVDMCDKYIYIVNTVNQTSAYFGPITVNPYIVMSGSPITANYTLDKDVHATDLLGVLINIFDSNYVPIEVILEDGSTAYLQCMMIAFSMKSLNSPVYDGSSGKVKLGLGLLLPEGYIMSVDSGKTYDLWVEIEVDITVDQTSK